MDLATLDTRDGRRRYNSSRQRETGTAALSADMGRRMNPIRAAVRANVHHHVGLARKVSQNQSEPFSLRRTCAGSAVITRGVSRAGPRYGSKDSEARAVRTACGGIVESAPEQQLLGPHSQRARKSQGLRGTSVG
jgi:hypothetical protein